MNATLIHQKRALRSDENERKLSQGWLERDFRAAQIRLAWITLFDRNAV